MDLRVERTHMFLHNAFSQLLEEKRFEEFTVNELCDRAMIRRATFYKHFADKYEYFTFFMREICSGFQHHLPAGETADNVNACFLHLSREFLGFIEKHEKLIRKVYASSQFPVLLDILSERIMMDALETLRQMKPAAPMTHTQMEGIAAFYSGGLMNTLRLFLKRGGTIAQEDFMDVISDFLNQCVR